MAKVTGVNKVKFKVKEQFKRIVDNPSMRIEIGEYAIEQMKFHARKGTPLQGRSVGSFPGGYPSRMTQKQREYLSRFNRTHPAYGPANPNLTITGQLLDAIKYRFRSERDKLFIEFFIEGNRKPYRTGSGGSRHNPTNEDVYEFLLDMNKRFAVLGLGPVQRDIITKKVREFLRRALLFTK